MTWRASDRAALVAGQERRRERRGLDPGPGQLEVASQPRVVEALGHGPTVAVVRRLERCPPEQLALVDGRRREIDHEPQPPQERRVDVALAVGRQDGHPVELLHALEQVVHLDVGESVVGVADLRAPAEQRVGLVKEQENRCPLALGEHGAQVLLGLADVFVDHPGEVDAEQVEPQVAGQDWAAIVLPVPLGPANSAVTPCPRGVSRDNPQSSRTSWRRRHWAASSRRWLSSSLPTTRSSHEYGRSSRVTRSVGTRISMWRQIAVIACSPAAAAPAQAAISTGRRRHSTTGAGAGPSLSAAQRARRRGRSSGASRWTSRGTAPADAGGSGREVVSRVIGARSATAAHAEAGSSSARHQTTTAPSSRAWRSSLTSAVAGSSSAAIAPQSTATGSCPRTRAACAASTAFPAPAGPESSISTGRPGRGAVAATNSVIS